MIANGLVDEAVAVVAADHGIGQVHVFDLGLQLAPMMLADPATEDDGDLVGFADCAISIKQPLPEAVQCGPAMKDQIVAELDLREKQPMLTTCLLAFFRIKEWRQPRQPLLAAGRQLPRIERVGKCWSRSGVAHVVKALPDCLKLMSSSCIRFASQ